MTRKVRDSENFAGMKFQKLQFGGYKVLQTTEKLGNRESSQPQNFLPLKYQFFHLYYLMGTKTPRDPYVWPLLIEW